MQVSISIGTTEFLPTVRVFPLGSVAVHVESDKFLMPNKNVKVFVNKGKVEFEKIEI